MNNKQNLLFICSRNQWRRPTAEEIRRKHPGYNARSAINELTHHLLVTWTEPDKFLNENHIG